MSFLSDFGRVNHRMHNKLFIMDDAVGIVGGRNIADIYFGVNAQQNFRDLDVMKAGPIVNELSSSFDLFWNSQWAVPVGAVVETRLQTGFAGHQETTGGTNRLRRLPLSHPRIYR